MAPPPRTVPPATAASPAESWGQTPAPSALVPILGEDVGLPLPAIDRGALLVLRQFDIANEVDLERVLALQPSQRTRPRATALQLSNPPVTLSLGTRRIDLAGLPLEAEASARIFDFGAISIRFRLPLRPGVSWAEMSALVRAAQVDEALTRTALELTNDVALRLQSALAGRHESELYEDYLVVFVERFAASTQALSLPAEAVSKLLLGEREDSRLAPAEVEETVGHRSSYYGDDLCVVGWNTALVVEPQGDLDAVDVLELANAQLLELRYYDALLDRELGRLYDEVGARHGRMFGLLRNYGPVLRRTIVLLLEIAEFIERAENALKIIGDVYLARLYASAVETLRIPSWERSVTRKQQLVQQVYDVLKSEVDASRGQLLELTVVVLIVGEILLALRFTH